jgi:hypothetical protein
MDQNVGIASALPGGAPATPGAPQPQAAASGVQSFVGPLTRMDMPTLLAEFNNPNSRFPKFALLTAMQEKQKQAQAQQAVQGQMAMAQNAQQGQAPVAAGILAGAQQTAAQEAAPQFRQGGVVAFQLGGSPMFKDPLLGGYTLQATPDAETAAEYERRKKQAREAEMTPLEQLLRWVEKKRERPSKLRSAMYPDSAAQLTEATSAAPAPATTDTSKLFPFGPPEGPMMDVPEVTIGGARSGTARPPGAPGAPAAVKPAVPTVDPLAAFDAAYKEANRVRLAGAQTTKEVADARAEEARIMQENLKAASEEARTAREAAEKRRADVVGAASRSILEDPEALLKLAGGMNTRRGMGIGSLAAGAGAELGRRREAMQAAEEKFAGEQKELRALDAANRQYNLSIAQLQKAYAEGNAERIRAAEQDVANNGIKLQEAKMDYGLKARDTESRATQARAAMISAGKPSSIGEQISFFTKDPVNYSKWMAAQQAKKNPYDIINDNIRADFSEWLKSTQGVGASPEQQRAKLAELQQYQLQFARQMGIDVPEAALKGGAGGGAQLKYNPATGKIE